MATAKKSPAPPARKRVDWEAVERDYRTGRFTDQELANKHGNLVTRQAITKMAKNRGWQKDLSDAVRRATKAGLIAEQAEQKVAEQVAKGCTATVDAVVAAAETNKQVILSHRKEITAARKLVGAMLHELSVATVDQRRLQDLMEILVGGDDMTDAQIGDARAALSNLTELPARVSSMQKLSQSMARLQELERKAFGLDEPEQPPPIDEAGDMTDEELERRIDERNERLARAAATPRTS